MLAGRAARCCRPMESQRHTRALTAVAPIPSQHVDSRDLLRAVHRVPVRTDLSVALLDPVNPSNTGSIGRTCVAASVGLHLINPKFDLNDKMLERVGLGYWRLCSVTVHHSWEEFLAWFGCEPHPKRLVGFTEHAEREFAKQTFAAG